MKRAKLRDTITASSIIGIIIAYILIVAINNLIFEDVLSLRFILINMAYGAPFIILAGFFNQYLVRWCNRHEWFLKNEHWTSLFQLLFSVFIAFIITFVAFIMFDPVDHKSYTDLLDEPYFQISLVADAMVNSFILMLAKYIDQVAVAHRQEKRIREVESEIIRVKYQQLKAQVNPHFLFNALNSLTSLINSNPPKAAEYTKQLAAIYRYLLSNDRQDVVFLSDEIKFIQKYADILHIRHGEGLKINIPNLTDPAVLSLRIIPTALQILIENACKHNIISKTYPLHIGITLDEKSITVTNNLAPRQTPADSIGLGLSGLKEKYKIIAGKNIMINQNDEFFSVTIPLLSRSEIQ